ncbi:hypothetical protein G7Y89_g12323 [Cudoniella acicularis]|uniref:Uncharacterized protein n=1 Tax=Cudoniella acicularis TaxID=354080 RepID=A0A8H4RBR3_9HELO|nr:hypothetical protein G7Y89_g12323 [Cudoniella acicularis]
MVTDMVTLFSFLAEGGWMLLLQLSLVRIQFYNRQNPRRKPLTSLEICFVVALLWTLFITLQSAFRFAISLVGWILFSSDGGPQLSGEQNHQARYIPGYLFYKVLATLLIHQGVNFLLETVVPLWREVNHDSDGVRQKVKVRIGEISEFLRDTNWGKFLNSSIFPDQRPRIQENSQMISLKRNQYDDPIEGQRILNWSITIDKNALAEMMETLGPPGGFGEMGFNVSRECVRFEAMGPKTRFNLTFEVNNPVNDKPAKKLRKKKASG